MRVAINVLPLKTAHKDRGIGYYTSNLLDALKKDASVEVIEFTKLSEVKNVDLIHYPWFDFYFHSLPIRKPFPTVVTIHDVIPLKFRKHYPIGLRGRINLYLQKLALQSCKEIITDSKTSKNDIIEYLKINENKITVIPLAASQNFRVLNDNKLIFTKRKNNLPDQFLLYVGDANWVKNLPFLIEGFKQIIKIPEFNKVKLVLVNGVFLKKVNNIDHPELESLRKANRLIEESNIQNQVIRPGNLNEDELVAFYNLATAYIQPSIYEGFGLPVLQALACGTPVISSNRGSLSEVGGNAAVYFDPTNLNKFKSIVSEILEDKFLQAKLSKLGLKRAAKFSWDKAISETKAVYEKVIRNDW